jgi:hypothetical protein
VDEVIVPPGCDQPEPLKAGPFGLTPWSTAQPFVLPTTHGDWDLAANWGCDSLVFALYHPDYDYPKGLWKSSPTDLLNASPRNVHYFFLSYVDSAPQDATDLEARFTQWMALLSEEDRAWWGPRLHFVPVPARSLAGWVGDVVRSKGWFAFAVDRFQRLREVGLLMDPIMSISLPQFRFLAYEAIGFEFEHARELALQAQGATVLPLLLGSPVGGGDTFAEVDLPDAAGMAAFDSLELDLGLYCPDHTAQNCPEWDRIVALYLCDQDAPDQCGTEIGRWVTTYAREGRWVTDVSFVLAFLKEGGHRRLRFNAQDAQEADLSVRLFDRGSGLRPIEARPLWSGGVGFNQDYNAHWQPVSFTSPQGTKVAQIAAWITGHGFGAEKANCAEFCNHTHHFSMNGAEFVKQHPEAGTPDGCLLRVDQGVVPDQYGTWPLGRGGWCPGWDVKPWLADVSHELVSGENTLTYKALYNGADYVPENLEGIENAFHAIIYLTSYLVFWQ